MQEEDFDYLLDAINQWANSPYKDEQESLPLSLDLTDLNAEQWITLQYNLKFHKVAFLELADSNIISFTPEEWETFLTLLRESNIEKLAFNGEPIGTYSKNVWKILFSIKGGFTRFGLYLSDINKMPVENVQWFFQTLANSNIVELDLKTSFRQAKTEVYNLFFNGLVSCKNIKNLILRGNSALGSANDSFWNICASHIAQTHIESLNLDRIALVKVTGDNWHTLCQGISSSLVRSLSLEDNFLCNFTPEQWQWFFNSLAYTNIHTLNLELNALYKLSAEAWKEFFSGLAKTSIKELNITEYCPLALQQEKWEIFCAGLKATSITTLHYGRLQFSVSQKPVIEKILLANKLKLEFMAENIENANSSNAMLQLYDKFTKTAEVYPLKEIQESTKLGSNQLELT